MCKKQYQNLFKTQNLKDDLIKKYKELFKNNEEKYVLKTYKFKKNSFSCFYIENITTQEISLNEYFEKIQNIPSTNELKFNDDLTFSYLEGIDFSLFNHYQKFNMNNIKDNIINKKNIGIYPGLNSSFSYFGNGEVNFFMNILFIRAFFYPI
jgi:hypothetical protein